MSAFSSTRGRPWPPCCAASSAPGGGLVLPPAPVPGPSTCTGVIHAFQPATAQSDSTARTVQGLIEPLTDRELEVLRLLAAGRRNRDIAAELVVTLETVKKHTSHIFDKLGVTNRTEAVAHARRLGLIA
jgi:ATP/maltotriose-dependent transcriptional regulator MalT